MDLNRKSSGLSGEQSDEESQQTQDYTLEEPPVKKKRYNSGDSWSHPPYSDHTPSEGTDSDVGIHFEARSRSGSDETGLYLDNNRPPSVVSGGFEPNKNDILADGMSESVDKIDGTSFSHKTNHKCNAETNDADDKCIYELDTDEDSVGSGGFLPIFSYNDDGISSGDPNSSKNNTASQETDSVSKSVKSASEASISESKITPPQIISDIDHNNVETSPDNEHIKSTTHQAHGSPSLVEVDQPISSPGAALQTTTANASSICDDKTQIVESRIIRSDSQEPSTSTKINLRKIASLNQDAENICGMLAITEVNAVYKRLCQVRDVGNRVDLVTNEILEDGLQSLQEKVQKESIGKSECDIFELVEQVKAALADKLSDVNLNEIFELLEMTAGKPDRVESVIRLILDKKNTHIPNKSSKSSNDVPVNEEIDVFKDVERIQKEVATADPNEIFTLLEEMADKFDNREDLVKRAIDIVKSKAKSNTEAECKSVESDADFSGMPLFKDLRTVSALFPKRDKNEIYAYLEAHYHDADRIQIVTEELLRDQGLPNPDPATAEQQSLNDLPMPNPKDPQYTAKLQEDVITLQKIFPECDPDYIYTELEGMAADPLRTHKLSARMFDRRDYPRLKDRLEKEKSQEMVTKLRNLELDIDEFLKMFPNPEETFYNEEVTVNGNYKKHALTQLLNDFPMITETYIKRKFEAHGDHYLPTMRDLDKVAQVYRTDRAGAVRSHKRFVLTQRPRNNTMPSVACELFYREALFCRNEDAILRHIKEIADAKTERIQQAKDNNELLECTCCYDDEVLLEDMLSCPDGHIFCRECIRRSSEAMIGESKSTFLCLDGDCELEFSTRVLQTVLPSNLFSIMLRRIQEEEIRRADIADLVGCPFCSFATVMANPDDKVFKCLNPDCLKESCRSCKEPNHIPLRCDEVEKESEKDMRAFIEKRMNEAMIRQCWQCKKNFYKVEGCNKMTCVCGAHMCYICRKPIEGYDHFNSGKCNMVDSNKLHVEEMEKAAKDAREEYERDHPEVKGQDLKHDPLGQIKNQALHHQMGPGYNFGDHGDDNDDSEDDDESITNSDEEDYWN